MSITAALSELTSKRKQIEETAREQAKAILAPGLKDFMAAHPGVKAIGWTQYTPYFNDGDPCVFRVGEIQVSASVERDEDLYGDGWTEVWGDTPKEGFTTESWSAVKELGKALDDAESELLAAFGDHVQVIVTADGVDVTEYSHD